jgi:hypothetical protein
MDVAWILIPEKKINKKWLMLIDWENSTNKTQYRLSAII